MATHSSLVAWSSFCMRVNKQRVGFSHEGMEPLLGGEKCNPGSQHLSVLGILQASILEWVAISFSRESFQTKD